MLEVGFDTGWPPLPLHLLAHSAACICLAHATTPPPHLAICFATVNYCPQCLPSALFSVGGVFHPTRGDGCLMRNDRPKNLNGQLRFRFGGGIDRSTAAVCLVIDGETPLRKNKCLRCETDKPGVLGSPHSAHFLFNAI